MGSNRAAARTGDATGETNRASGGSGTGRYIAFVLSLAGTVILGYFFNEFVLSLARLPLPLTLGLLLLLAVLTGFAHDIQGQTNAH